MKAEFAYDTSTTKEGRLLSMRYPTYWDPSLGTTRQGLGLSFEYDDMGRLLRLRNTDTQEELVRSPAYNVAGQLTQWERQSVADTGGLNWLTENFSYTTQGQLDRQRMKLSSASAYFLDDQYYYNDAGDGTVKQRKDNAAGDAVDYTYNVLGQLIKAETTSNEWGQSFVFDGFGNLAQQVVTKGSAPSMTLNVNPANNQVTGSGNSYDAAGNLTSTLYGGNMTYDLASRLASVQGMPVLRYTARNERLIVNKFDGTREVHMRGIGGEMIGVYRIDWENGNSSYTKPVRLPERERVHVAGRLLFEGGKFVATDRLGSVAYKFGTGLAVQNGGFETGVMAPWAPYGGAQHTITMTPHSGSYALRQTIATTEGGAYQDVKGLVTGMSYQFRVWVRSEAGLVNGSLAVSDTVGNNIAWTGVQSISSTWREFLVTFTATSQGIARIHLVKWDTTGALLWDDAELVNGATAISGLKMRYYPYGQEVGTATANDTAKFGTYTRDASSGLDYAMNRYYQSWWGRFTTADPYRASGGPGDPGSWNRYSYVQGDPVNWLDPMGLYQCGPEGCFEEPGCDPLNTKWAPGTGPCVRGGGWNPPKATCEIQLKYEDVKAVPVFGNHAFLAVVSRDGGWNYIEGLPERQTFRDWGKLVYNGGNILPGSAKANAPLAGVKLNTSTNAIYSNEDICDFVDRLFYVIDQYMRAPVGYNSDSYMPGVPDSEYGPNSNTFIRFLLVESGLINIRTQVTGGYFHFVRPPEALGWMNTIP